MSRQPEKHTWFSQSRFFLCALALAWGCNVAPSNTEVLESTPLESTLPDDNVEVAACELEVDCCGNLNCAPAPCPIVCI
jgi:hypothetical protein